MTILGTILTGLLIGLIAGALKTERTASGFFILSIVGIAGATLGRLIGATFGVYVAATPESFIVSAIGAIVLLLGYIYVTPMSSPGRA
jgi:uncharacterized membrane protein YeaQ/YmgE (transglycosylase-associated protein family)